MARIRPALSRPVETHPDTVCPAPDFVRLSSTSLDNLEATAARRRQPALPGVALQAATILARGRGFVCRESRTTGREALAAPLVEGDQAVLDGEAG